MSQPLASILGAIIWTAFVLSTISPANAEAVAESIKVPIFFVTDRNRTETKEGKVEFGTERRPFTDTGDDPDFGLATIVTRNSANKDLSPSLSNQGWANGSSQSNGTWEARLIKGENFQQSEQKFYDQVRAELAVSPDKKLFVFVPGYMSTFRSGLETSARIAYFTQHPVLLYSWASAGKFKEYSSDESSIEWSQDHFNEVIDKLTAMTSDDPSIKIYLWGHSMGARLVLRAVPHLRENNAFAEMTLVCPDTDAGLVMHYARRFYSTKGTANINLYMSHHDKMMSLSKLVHGGYLRLGQERDIGTAVEQAIGSRAGATQSATLANKVASRVKTIDFTSIDRGGLGHRIPVRLMVSSALNQPIPEEIELVAPGGKEEPNSSMILKVVPRSKSILRALRKRLPTKDLLFGKNWSLD